MLQIYHLISETILDYGNYFLRLCIIEMPTRNGTWCVFIFLIISDKNTNVDFIKVKNINSINLNLDFLIKEHSNIMILWVLFLVFNTTFSNISAISWRPVLVVEEAGVPGLPSY